MFEHNRALTTYACSQERWPDLIVWPETSVPGDWVDAAPGVSAAELPPLLAGEEVLTRQQARHFVCQWQTNLLLGFALCEATGLFGLVVAFILMFGF